MTRNELIAALAEDAEVSKAVAERVLGAFMDTVMAEVGKGENVALVGFGKFSSSVRLARDGRNPATGETIKIPAARVPKFSAGAVFKTRVQKGAGA